MDHSAEEEANDDGAQKSRGEDLTFRSYTRQVHMQESLSGGEVLQKVAAFSYMTGHV
jgi:hypothetical protein